MRSYLRPAGLVLSGGALAVGLAACGSSAPSTAKVAATSTPSRGGARQPGATGKVTAVSGSSFTVQGQASTTDVSYTSATTFARTGTVALSALRPGECVTVVGTPAAGSGPLTARSVSARPATDGGCTTAGGPGGFGGGHRPSGAPSGQPNARPSRSGAPGGRFGGGANGFGGAFLTGSVVSVSGSSLVVDGTVRTVGPTSPSASASAADTTVLTSASTTVEQTVPATSDAVTVGSCVTAVGRSGAGSTTSSTLSLTATRVTLSAPTNGSCSTTFGFGGRGFGRPGAGQGAGQGTTGA